MKISSHAMRVFLLASVLVSATVLLLPFTEPAQAEGTAYVSNMGQPSFSSTTAVSLTGNNRAVSQKFTTGTLTDASATFALAGVEMNLATVPAHIDAATFKITLQTVNNSGNPTGEIFQFPNPDPVVRPREQFAAPSGTQLAQNTSYAIVVEYASDETPPRFRRTQRHDEDSGAASGWSIDNQNKVKGSGGSWGQGGGPLKIKVLETLNNFPTASDGTVETNEGTAYTFEERDFGFVDSDDSLDHVKITSLPGTGEGTLSLNSSAVAVDDEVSKGDINGGKLQYTPPASGSGRAFTSFKFKVSDGLDDSAEYDMSINVYVAFVSNTGQVTNDGWQLSTTGGSLAQAFTTGSNPKGYDLGSFTLELGGFGKAPANMTTIVKLYSSKASGEPDTELCTLVTPNVTVGDPAEGVDGVFTFAAPSTCPTMAKDTEYFVVVGTEVSNINEPYGTIYWEITNSSDQDSNPSPGWSIRDGGHKKNGQWADAFSNSYRPFKIKVNGELIPNALPTSANATVTTNEDTTFIFGVANFTFSDTDPGDTLYAVITSLPDAGTLWLDADGDGAMVDDEEVSVDDSVVAADLVKLKYTPPANANGDPYTTFKFRANDGYEDSDSEYTITVDVTAVNDAPVVTGPATVSVAENMADDTILATYTATDVEGDTLKWTTGQTESSEKDDTSEFSLVDGRLYFASSRNYEDAKDTDDNNVYEVRVIASDDDDDGGLDVTVEVTDVNDPPVAVDDNAETDEGIAVNIDVLANDTDEDEDMGVKDTLTVTSVGTPTNGAAVISSGNIAYTPSTGFAGIDTFDYTLSDGSDTPALTDTGTVTVKVRPVVSGTTPSFAENGTGTVATYTAGGSPTWSLEETEDYLLFSIDASSGVLTFKSPPDFENPADADAMNDYNVTVLATVGTGDDAVTGTLPVTVTVIDVNEAPVAVDDYAFTNEVTAVNINVVANDTDVDAGTTLSVTEVGTPANGAAVIAANNTTITYTPDAGFAGYDTFTYTVSDHDANDPRTDTGTVTVSVAPVVSGGANSGEVISYEENGTGTVATYTANGNPTWRLTGDDRDAFTIDSGGVLRFNSSPDFESPASADGNNNYEITVVATVQSGGSSVTATKSETVTVTNVTDPPTVTGLTQVDYAENGTGDVATYTSSGSPAWDLLGPDSADFAISGGGVLTFNSPPNYEIPVDGDEDNVYEVTVQAALGSEVGELDVTITVTDLPGVSGPAVSDYPENGTVAVVTYTSSGSPTWSLLGADEGDFAISNVADDTNGELSFASPPNYEKPADGTEGDRDNIYEVTVRASEGTEVSTLAVTVTVVDVDDTVPTAVDDTATTAEDTPVDIAVLDNDLLALNSTNTLSVSEVGNAGNGTVSTDNSTVTYAPAEHFNGEDSFTYTISDGTNTATGTVTVTVTPVNDEPSAETDNVVTVANTAIVIDVVANDTDVDGDALIVSAVETGLTRGTAVITDGLTTKITYTPNGSDYTQEFTYTVSDGIDIDTGTVRVTVESADADVGDLVALSGLTVTSGTGNQTVELNEEFAEDTVSYTLNVPNSVSSVQVSPKKKYDTSVDENPDTADNVMVKIRVNGAKVVSGSSILVVEGGVTNIEIEVIATISPSDGVVAQVSQTYTIRVTRPARPTSSNANLAALTVSGVALDTDFKPGITDYTMTVDNSVASISLDLVTAHGSATVAVTANGVEAPADNIPLTEGGTTVITVVVTAQDGSTSKTYTITVTRAPSANADLVGLTVSGGALDTDFDSGITDYSMTVANSVASIDLDPKVAHGSATFVVTANGVEAPADNIPLTEGGTTVITVVVTAQDGTTTRIYTIRVTRAPSANADLVGLTISEGSLDTDFEPGITSYSVAVANSVSSVSVFPRAANANATVTVKVNGVEVPADNIPLTEGGTTVITLLVTAQDGTTTRTYTIRVTRVPSSLSANSDLAGLTISGGSLNIDFEPGITSYSVAVANSVSSVSVFPRAANADATVSVKVNGMETPADNIPLTEGGTTVINVVVTAQDGSTSKTYTITVFRAARVSVGRRGGGSGSRVSRILIPSFVEGSQTIRSVAENTPGGANIGAPIVATDPTDDRLTYSLLGGDAAQFGIDAASGRLLTNGPLDFESKSGYRVSVSVSNSRGGRDTIAVTINLTNVDEPGTVAVLPAQPAVGRATTAVLTDPDGGVNGITWQWAVSSDQVVWLDIAGATLDTYSPVADDGGKYLRATAFYTDGEGTGKSAQATWDTPLVPPAALETTLTPTPAAVAPSPEPTRAASPTTVASSAVTPPTTPSAVPSAAVVPTPAPAAGVPATSALEQAADDSGIDLWVILLISAVVAAVAAGLIILGVRIIRA